MTAAEIIMLVRIGISLYHKFDGSDKNAETTQRLLAEAIAKFIPGTAKDKQALAGVGPDEIRELFDILGGILRVVPDAVGKIIDHKDDESCGCGTINYVDLGDNNDQTNV